MKLLYGYFAFLLSFSTITAKTNTTLVSKCKLKLVSDEDLKKDSFVNSGRREIEDILENLVKLAPGFKAVVTLPDLKFCIEPQNIVFKGAIYDFGWTTIVYTIKCENPAVCDPKKVDTQISSKNGTARYLAYTVIPIQSTVFEVNCK